MDKALNDFTGLIRRAVDDYGMIQDGDRVAVGVSGGKDSLVLLLALDRLRKYYPRQFELEAVTIELGFDGMDFSPVAELCARINIPYICVKTDIKQIVFDVRKEDNPCSLCAKMRRGALGNLLRERGISKLALGHHFDDAVETFMMSLLFEGRLSCFQPVTVPRPLRRDADTPADIRGRAAHIESRPSAGAAHSRKPVPAGQGQQAL